MNEEKKKEKSPIGLVKRPAYDPIIEDMNQKATEAVRKRQSEVTAKEETRTEQSAHGRTQGISVHGKRINPDKHTMNYVGSFCCHIYRSKITGGLIAPQHTFVSFTHGPVPQVIGTKALEHLNMQVRDSYGIAQPGTLDKRKSKIQEVKKDL